MELVQHLGPTRLFFIIFILSSFTTSRSESRAHHKVHNLALYPERHSWCQATPIRQEIAGTAECQTKTIDNVVCLGACFSYSVPRSQDDPVIPPYCDACRPTISSWKQVTLNCTKPTTGEPYQLAKNVEIISNCSCVDCQQQTSTVDNKPSAQSNDDGGESVEDNDVSHELPDSLFEANEANEVDEQEDTEPIDDPLPPIPTLHKLKSVSEELKEFNKAVDEETMIKDNKIPSDDDHDHDDSARILKERERERERAAAAAAEVSSSDDED